MKKKDSVDEDINIFYTVKQWAISQKKLLVQQF